LLESFLSSKALKKEFLCQRQAKEKDVSMCSSNKYVGDGEMHK
jgi:hypothetical protein